MHVYSNANHQPDRKDQPIAWAFFVISEDEAGLRELDHVMEGYDLVRWIEPGKWALIKEVFWRYGEGIDEVRAELAFYAQMGEELKWELQATPGLLFASDVRTNFYFDPNEAMRYWVEAAHAEVV